MLFRSRRLTREARIRRLVGQLARKGYPGGLAVRVVREALAEEGDLDDVSVDLGVDVGADLDSLTDL
jgi:regulatory protein